MIKYLWILIVSLSQANSNSQYSGVYIQNLNRSFSNVGAEKQIFLDFLNEQDFEKAFYQSHRAFSGHDLSQIQSVLLMLNGLPRQGFKTWIKSDPNGLISHPTNLFWNQTLSTQTKLFVDEAGLDQTKIFEHLDQDLQDLWKLQNIKTSLSSSWLTRRVNVDSQVGALASWVLSQKRYQENSIQLAVKTLSNSLKLKSLNPSQKDLFHLTLGRWYYELGRLKESQNSYSQISSGNSLWLEAQEEQSWLEIRRGQMSTARAFAEALGQPSLRRLVGPEASYLRSIVFLKTCNYTELGSELDHFVKFFKPLYQQNNPEMTRYLKRDETVKNLNQKIQDWTSEKEKLQQLYQASMNEAPGEAGFRGALGRQLSEMEKTILKLRGQRLSRLQTLWSLEKAQIQDVARQMQLVEGEGMQQIEQLKKIAVAKTQLKTVSKTKASVDSAKGETLRFDFEGERWFDELGQYQVDMAGVCRPQIGAR